MDDSDEGNEFDDTAVGGDDNYIRDPDYIPEEEDEDEIPPLEGRRIVDMKFVCNQVIKDYRKFYHHRCDTNANS